MVIQKLEDLKTWIEARKLAKLVYPLLEKLPVSEKYILRKHLWECIRNVAGNIAEGFGRYHYQESLQFYRIARGSINEAKSDTYLCLDRTYWTENEVKIMLDQIETVLQLLNGLIASTKRRQKIA